MPTRIKISKPCVIRLPLRRRPRHRLVRHSRPLPCLAQAARLHLRRCRARVEVDGLAGACPECGDPDVEIEALSGEIARRGEAISLFLDEEPTYGYFPPVYYYQGRIREGLNSASFSDSYRTYLDIRGEAGEDPLLTEVRNRVE